jgi:nucleoside-diphosphate-sugar epimerase
MTVSIMNNDRVLVAGGAGVIGSRLVHELLRRGYKVRVLDTRYGGLEGVKNHVDLEFVGIGSDGLRGGMMDKQIVKEAVEGVSVVYHLAINWDGASWRHELPVADLLDTNVRGTLNLLEASKSQGVKHFLFSSSAAVYGDTERSIALRQGPAKNKAADEETACLSELWHGDPGPAYATVKLTTEKLCMLYHHHYDLPVTVFRIEYVFSSKEELDDYANIHVDDVVEAFLLAKLNRKAYGQVFNLAYPTPYISVKKITNELGWKPLRTEEIRRKRSAYQ